MYNAYGYVADDGNVYALMMRADRAALMGFAPCITGLPKRPHRFLTRKEVFVRSDGEKMVLPYPTTTLPHALGSTITYNGATWTAIGTLDEAGTGVST